jgi:hypothetical protein
MYTFIRSPLAETILATENVALENGSEPTENLANSLRLNKSALLSEVYKLAYLSDVLTFVLLLTVNGFLNILN